MITSKTNELVKHIKSLQQKKYRDLLGEYVIEGIKIVEEAIKQSEEIVKIVVSESFQETLSSSNIEIVSDSIFHWISDTQTPQGVLAILKKKRQVPISGDIVFALDNVQDPGNVGTIIRTLDAAGIQDLILTEGCADVYSPKVVRSTMGGILRVNLVHTSHLEETIKQVKEQGYQVVVTSLDTTKLIYDIHFHQKQFIIIGNESKGVSLPVQELADKKVKIPMPGKAESLNASVAASIIAYEAVRQKMN